MGDKNILLIDKPKGITSFDVIRALRRKLNIKKMGHAGTLDPLATGLLIIGIDEGTKKMNEFLKLPKTYEADVTLGIATDTGDTDGAIIAEEKVLEIPEEKIRETLSGIVGEQELSVPVYSAVKMRGKPLYWRARQGEVVTPPIKKMYVGDIKLLEAERDGEHVVLKLVMDVGSGTYVRSIAEEIGRRLGVGAVVSKLRRTRIGEYSVSEAKKLEEL